MIRKRHCALTAVKPTQRKLPVICRLERETISRIQFASTITNSAQSVWYVTAWAGLSGGERASALAAQEMTQHLLENAQATDISTEMGRAALRLNEKVKDIRDSENRKIEAGTTLTAVFIRNGELFWCGIGDSHIYLYRAGELRQLNIDHNFGMHLDQMVQEGSISSEEALRHPQRAALTSYLGIQELTLISGNRMPLPLQKDDVLLQCTDGLYRCLSDDAICQILNAIKRFEAGLQAASGNSSDISRSTR